MSIKRIVLYFVLASCGRIGFDGRADSGTIDSSMDGAVDASMSDGPPQYKARLCNTWGAFGAVSIVNELSAAGAEQPSSMSSDGLTIYFYSDSGMDGGQGAAPYYAKRASLAASWGTPVRIGEVDTAVFESDPIVTQDDLTLYFTRQVNSRFQVYVATRASANDAWTNPTQPDPTFAVANYDTSGPVLGFNELEFYVHSTRIGAGAEGSDDIYLFKRDTVTSSWQAAVRDATLSTSGYDTVGTISSDGLEIYGRQGTDLWVATRATLVSAWSTPVLMTALNTAGVDSHPLLSPDGTTLYFASDRLAGNVNIFQTSRACLN